MERIDPIRRRPVPAPIPRIERVKRREREDERGRDEPAPREEPEPEGPVARPHVDVRA